MADIFISHSSRDNEVAAAIRERIQRERPSWSLFYDKDNIRAGQRWQERLREELTSCRVVLALLSRDWLGSPWCFTEAVTATFRGKDVVGIETEVLTGEDLARAPPILHERQRVRLRDGDERAWQEILEALDRSGLDPDNWFSVAPNVGPYPGLVAFDERDAGVFFGRKQEITEYLGVLDTLRGPDRSQVLVISGASGSGKSSLLRAGLIPRLRRKPEWVVISPFEVAREPVHNLLDRLSQTLAALGTPAQGLDLTKPPDDPMALAKTLDETLRRLEQATSAWVLLPLDQAEVLVTGDRPASDPARLLLDALAQLLGWRTRHVIVAATIRTEFVPRLEAVFAGTEVRLRQAPVSAIGSLAEVIEKPAERFGIELEPGLSEQIVADVHSADALPLLAYTLKELNDRGGRDRCLTLDEYQTLGGVQGAIATKLDEVLSDPEPTELEYRALRRAFTRHLVRVDEGAVEGERLLRRVVSRASLPQAADRLLRRLVDAGLLTTKDGTIELAHERLINDWPVLPLKTWLAQDANDRRLIDQLRERVTDNTLPDGLLVQAEELLQRDQELAAEEPALARLVQRSRERKRSRERRWWVVLGVISIAAIGFLGLAWWALEQRSEAINQTELAERAAKNAQEQADEARQQTKSAQRSRALMLAGLSMRETEAGRPERGLLLALAADPERPTRRIILINRDDVPLLTVALERAIYAGMDLRRYQLDGEGFAASWSPDGRHIVTASEDKTARIWNTETGDEVRALTGHEDKVYSAAFSPDGRRIATASEDKTARIWDAETGKMVRVLIGHGDKVYSAAFSPDGRLIATGSGDNTARIWNAETGREMRVLAGHQQHVSCVAFSPDGRRILTASWDWTARIWDTETGELLHAFGEVQMPADAGEAGGGLFYAAFSPDGRRVLTASMDRTARIWDAETGREERVLAGHAAAVLSAAFSPDGRRILTTSQDRTVRIWDAGTGDIMRTLTGHQGPVSSGAFSPDGRRVVTASEDKTVRLWDSQIGFEVRPLTGHQGPVYRAEFSVDGSRIVTASWDGKAIIWDAATGNISLALPGQPGGGALGHREGGLLSAAFSGDGLQVATASSDKTARIWDAKTGRELRVLTGHDDSVSSISFGPHGQRVVTASWDKTARIWDVETGKVVRVLAGHDDKVSAAMFSADGARVVTASWDKTARIWDVETGKVVRVLAGHDDKVSTAMFSADGSRVATASWDKTARIWDAQSGQELRVLTGHSSRVSGAVFSPDALQVLTASWDKTARIWDVETGQEIHVLAGHQWPIEGVAFSPDARYIVTAARDNTARIWAVLPPVSELWELAGQLKHRDLTEAERQEFFLND
jgi:WD40 repeat protein